MSKIIMFDIDDTIVKTTNANYSSSKPIKKRINQINKLYENGHYIKIFTARYMGRNKENSNLVKKNFYKKTYKQLLSLNLKFHELIMGKPTYDIHVDDKSYNAKEKKTFNMIEKLIGKKNVKKKNP
tara:strand:- start:42147 stop:42524 length:378 start_codon:yes stop_codon:yes gene_type:complete